MAGERSRPHITINDINRMGGADHSRFINTRNLEHYAWTVALTL